MSNKQTACNNDMRLEQMAHYIVSCGLTKPFVQQDYFNKFVELKQLVKKGSFTLENLEDMMYAKYGVLEKCGNDNFLNNLQALTKELSKTISKNTGKTKQGGNDE
jgi:hypothetical protein